MMGMNTKTKSLESMKICTVFMPHQGLVSSFIAPTIGKAIERWGDLPHQIRKKGRGD